MMYVRGIVLVVFLCGCAVVSARRKRERTILRFADCGKENNRPIHFYDVKASPMPVIIPGTLYVSFTGNVTEDLPRRVSVELSIMKYFFGIPFMIPCFDNHIGSCTYDNICHRLEKYEQSGCPKTLRAYNVQCHCPFQAGDFTVSRVPVNVPKIHGFAGALINGDYELVLSILDENRSQLGCLELKFSMKKRHRGWLFKI
ncbi:ganglioside GM2 activator-like [Haliotis asinina]|uniref:ganglioside GM2 activator-like n=1 Tax=Haliotis asinina TaxID=109174 RepID=UPI0035323294